ncbi:MAG: hypothetical protein ACREBZ_03925 [Thermoplasmata archaeon]
MAAVRTPLRTPRGTILAIEGASGAGKTAIARALALAEGSVRLAEALHYGAPLSIRFTTDAQLKRIEERLVRREIHRWALAERLARSGRSVVLDTAPWGPLSYTYGLVRSGCAGPGTLRYVARLLRAAMSDGRLGSPDLVLYLDVPVAERRRRAARDRLRHPPMLFERHLAASRGERELWLGRWSRIVPVRRLRVRSGESVPSVVGRALRAWRASPLREPRARASTQRLEPDLRVGARRVRRDGALATSQRAARTVARGPGQR